MKVTVIIIVSFALLIALLVIGAGIALYLQFKPNSRVFLLDNIRMMGALNGKQAQYGAFEVGNPDQPYCGTLGLSFRCGDAEVHLDQMTEEQLFQMATQVTSANPESITGGRWPDDAKRLRLCDLNAVVIVAEGRILQVVIGSRRDSQEQVSQFRTGRVATWYSFPLTDADAVSLFGTPDRTNDFFRH